MAKQTKNTQPQGTVIEKITGKPLDLSKGKKVISNSTGWSLDIDLKNKKPETKTPDAPIPGISAPLKEEKVSPPTTDEQNAAVVKPIESSLPAVKGIEAAKAPIKIKNIGTDINLDYKAELLLNANKDKNKAVKKYLEETPDNPDVKAKTDELMFVYTQGADTNMDEMFAPNQPTQEEVNNQRLDKAKKEAVKSPEILKLYGASSDTEIPYAIQKTSGEGVVIPQLMPKVEVKQYITDNNLDYLLKSSQGYVAPKAGDISDTVSGISKKVSSYEEKLKLDPYGELVESINKKAKELEAGKPQLELERKKYVATDEDIVSLNTTTAEVSKLIEDINTLSKDEEIIKYNKVEPSTADDVTILEEEDEKAYQEWKLTLPENLQYEGDYDLRGFYQKNPTFKAEEGQHLTDEFKRSNHPTFSNESKYYKEGMPSGRWEGDKYIPENRSPKVTEYLTKAQRIMEVNGELPTLKQKAQEKLRQYELTNQKEIAYKKKLKEFNDLLEKTKKLTPDSFMNKLALKYKDKLTSDIIINEFTKESNRFRYQLLQSAKLVPIIPESSDETLKGILMSRTFQNATKSEKIIILNEYFVSGGLRKTDKQAFFDKYKKFIYTPLDIAIIKQQAIESKKESDSLKALTPAVYKRPVNKTNLSDVSLSKYDNNWLGISPFDTDEEERKRVTDELIEKIIAIPETESGIWNDFIKGIQNSSKKNWIPVLGGFIDYNEQRIIKDAFIAKNPTFEQKRLRKIFNDIAQVRAKFHQDDASWFDIGETLFPELIKFAMENTILNGVLGVTASAFKDTVAQKTVIELAKKMNLISVAEAVKMSELPIIYVAKQLTKGAVASQTVALGTSLSQALQMTIPAAQAMADPEMYSESDLKLIVDTLQPRYVNYIHSSLNQTIGFGLAGLGHQLEKPFGGIKTKLATLLDDYFKVAPQRAVGLYEMVANKEVQNTISLAWAYNQAKLMTSTVGGVLKNINQVGIEMLKKAELQSFPAQTVEMHIMAIMHQQVGRYFDPHVEMPELSLYKTGVEAFKVMSPLILTKTLFGASRITLGVGLHMYNLKGTSKIQFDKVDIEMIGAKLIKRNGLPILTFKTKAKVAFESVLDKILKESRDEILDRDNYENILNEIDHIDTSYGEHKLAKIASRVLDFRVQFENSREAEAGRLFRDHYEAYKKQKETVEGFIISSSVKGYFDSARADELLQTITEDIPRNELDYHISVCKEYERLHRNNLIPDNINLGEYMAREGRKLLNIESIINNYIYSGGVINFEKIRIDIDNTVISRDKYDYLIEALDAAHTKYIRSENITVDGLSIISNNTETKVARRYSDTVKERSDKFTQTRGLQDANGNYNLKAVGEDVVFEDTVNPENFINYIVDNLTHIPEPVRQVIFGTLGRNKSLSDADKKMLIDRVSSELQTKLVDNKIEPEEAVKQMALINEGLEMIGSTYTVNEVGNKPTNGILLYAYMRGRFHYNSANNRFFLDKYEFEEAMGVINASKNFSQLISTDAITSLENKCVTDSNYTITDEVDIDKDDVVKSSWFTIKNKTKLTEKHLSDWFKDINNIDNFVDKGQKKAIIQMLLNTANNFVRFGIIDNTIDFLRLLPSVKTLNQRRKAKITPEQINDDVLYQVKQEVKKQFTSRLQKAIEGISDKKQELTGAQWIIEINKSANKGEGLSQDEIKWTGLREFLDRRADEVITRDKVEQVFNAGLEKITPKVRILEESRENRVNRTGYNTAIEKARAEGNFGRASELMKEFEELSNQPKYNKGSQWDYVTQIGGDGYKEVIFYIDNVTPYGEYDDTHFGDKTDGNGALFWTRISDYTNEHGERVRFVEEIQSNRNQSLSKVNADIKFLKDVLTGVYSIKIINVEHLGNPHRLYFNKGEKEVKLNDSENVHIVDKAKELLRKDSDHLFKNIPEEIQIEYINKAIDVYVKELSKKSESLSNQFEGNNWKNLAAKWIINDAIAHGIDKIELTGAETQVKRSNNEKRKGHEQFYDKTMPDIFKKLGLEQGETKVITDGVSEVFFYVNGKKVTEELSTFSNFTESMMNDVYPELNNGKDFNSLSSEEKDLAIQKFLTPEYKNELKKIYDEQIEKTNKSLERAKFQNNEYGISNENDILVKQWENKIHNLEAEKADIDKIETIERKAEEGKQTGNTHTFTITDKTKETLADKVDLFQTEEGYIQGYFEHLKNQIVLLRDANFSTLMHELGHSFRFMLKVAADSGNTKAAEKLKVFDDFALGEEGKKFFEDKKIQGEHSLDNFKFINELWARSFEKYLWDGTAKGIKDVNFKALLSQFRDWMRELYVSIKNSALNIKLTPEVRDVFESVIGNKNKLFELKEYITQRLGRPSWRKHLTAELVRDIIEKMKTSRLDPETHQESMLLLNEVINHYKRQYVANKYKANSRLVNPDLQKLMYTPKFMTIEGYEKHIELFTKILNDARFKWSWINMGKNLMKARRRVLSNKRDNLEFYTALSELTKVEANMFTKQKDIEDFTALLNYKPNDVGIAEFKAKVQKFTDMSSEYKKELYKERLEKEARAKDENDEEVVPTGISDLGLSETRAEREKNVNATREYAVQVGNVDTMKETESIFFGLDTSRMTDSELNHYNSILTNVIRSKGKFEVTNEIVEFNNVYTARLTNESLEESMSDYWRLKLKELNYKATNVNPLTRNLLNRALNPHGFGVLSNYNLRDTLNFLDGIVEDYSGEIVKTIFEPLSENHDKMRTILNNVFGKINQFKNGKDSLKEGAFNKVGVAWLLSQKPEIKIEANDLDPNKNTFIDEETGMPTTIWEKIGISENEVRKNFLPDETISPEEFYEKDNNGVWNLKENLTPLQESRYEVYKKMLDLRLNYLKDSIMVSFGEKPDNMSEEEFDYHLREMTKTTEFLSTSRHVAKFGKPSFFEAAISEIQSKRLSLLEATGFNSVKEFLQSDIELSDKESQFMALGVSLFDQLQDGQFSGGRTMKETADAYTANNIVPYTGIRNYAPIIRFNTTTLEQAEDVLGTMPGQQKTGEFMGIRTGLNLSNNFVRQRKQNVSTINTNSFEMIEKRFDQELFYILHEPHRLFLRELLNKQNGLFGKDKYGNSKKDSGKVDNITTDYIRNMIALYYRRGATNAKLKVRNSPGYSTINNIVNDYKIASLGLVRNSFAQMTSTWMAQENLLGSPLERMQDIANGYGDVFGSMTSDVIGTKSDADNMIETYAQEVAFRGLTDYNLGTGKQSPTLGNLMKSYRDGSMETEQGYFGNLLKQFKDIDRSRERVLLPMVFFDRLAARATFFGAYRNYCRHQGIELSYKNPDIDAVNFARDVVRATQHTDNELFKPGVLGGVSARENANPFSDNNFNDNSALFELLRSGYWNFKSFTLVEKNNMAIKLLKATNKDGVHGTGKDKIDYATALAYNITGNMLFNYAKSVAKSYFAAMSVYTAYNMGLGRAANEDDNESILSKLTDGDWSEMNHINTQAKNKAEDAKNEIWDTEISVSDNVTMSPSEKRMHGLFYNTMKSIVGQYGLNEMSDYAFRQLVLAGHNKLVEMTDGGELDEKFVKTYAGADKIDFLGLYSGLFGLPYLVGSDQTDKGTVSNDMINLAKSVGPGKDVEPEHLVSALQFVTSALGYGIYSKYPVHYPAINKWLRENRKEEVKLTPEQVEHNNSLDEVVAPVNQGDGLEDESDNGE